VVALLLGLLAEAVQPVTARAQSGVEQTEGEPAAVSSSTTPSPARGTPAAALGAARLTPAEKAAARLDALLAPRPIYHAVGEPAVIYRRPQTGATAETAGSPAVVDTLAFREAAYVDACEEAWCRVAVPANQGSEDASAALPDTSMATGYVPRSAISNVWLRADKQVGRLYLYRGSEQVRVFEADFGYNAFSDKKQQGSLRLRDQWRTPEGTFYIVHKNRNSQFHRALVLNYPTVEDAERGRKRGMISPAEARAIREAQAHLRMPPMNTALGGWIEIHGEGTGGATNWTHGCIALTNAEINDLWWWVQKGTPVRIE
jgi:hypothetical protein